MFTFVQFTLLVFKLWQEQSLSKSYQIQHSKYIGRPGSGLEYIFQRHFTKFAQIKKFICTDKSLANIKGEFLNVSGCVPNCFSECRNSKQRKGIWIHRPPVPEFRYAYVNSETSLNYEFRRTLISEAYKSRSITSSAQHHTLCGVQIITNYDELHSNRGEY